MRMFTINQSKSLLGFWVVMTSLEGINGPLIQTLLRGKNDSKQSDEIQVSKYALLTKCEVKMAGYWLSSLFVEGDIGGYPILQYRTKKWQIPKYRNTASKIV